MSLAEPLARVRAKLATWSGRQRGVFTGERASINAATGVGQRHAASDFPTYPAHANYLITPGVNLVGHRSLSMTFILTLNTPDWFW